MLCTAMLQFLSRTEKWKTDPIVLLHMPHAGRGGGVGGTTNLLNLFTIFLME